MEGRLPITDLWRIRARDSKLWLRDQRRASLYNFPRIPCPCSVHKGAGRSFGIDEVGRHLFRHGRSSECWTWRGPGDPDSSNEEWEEEFFNQIRGNSNRTQNRDSGLEVKNMMRDLYQQVESFAETKERIDNITVDALEAADHITSVNDFANIETSTPAESIPDNQQGDNREAGLGQPEGVHNGHGGAPHHESQPDGRPPERASFSTADQDKLEEERIKDAKALEDAMCLLYPGSKHSKLGSTIMLVNLVATHQGVTEKAADDLFATVNCLLPPGNTLPTSMYQAKSLTKRLGLEFQNIDGCPTGCVLFLMRMIQKTSIDALFVGHLGTRT